jgi:replicative DNA helicase
MVEVEKKKLDPAVLQLEKEILYFILKDKMFVEEIFQTQCIELDYFQDENIRKIAQIAKDYYESFGNVLVENEFISTIDEAYNQKRIDDIKHAVLLKYFEEVTNPDEIFLADAQFDSKLTNWISAEVAIKTNEIIRRNLQYLNENQGLEARQRLIEELDKLQSLQDSVEGIEILDLVDDADQQIADLIDRRTNQVRGLATGIEKLDKKFNGFEPGTLTLIGGITGSGKSTLMMNFSRSVFKEQQKKVLIISLEMNIRQWSRKYSALDFRADASALVRGNKEKINDAQFEEIVQQIKNRKDEGNQGAYKIISIPAQTKSWPQIVSICQKRFPLFEPDIIFIDQLSLINLGRYSNHKLQDGLGFLTKEIRAYAQKKGIPIVIAVQANRSSISRTKDGKRVVNIDVENVEDSNKVIADADNFLAINPVNGEFKTIINIVKQREGPKEPIEVKANLDYGAIYDENHAYYNATMGLGDLTEEQKAEMESETNLESIQDLEQEMSSGGPEIVDSDVEMPKSDLVSKDKKKSSKSQEDILLDDFDAMSDNDDFFAELEEIKEEKKELFRSIRNGYIIRMNKKEIQDLFEIFCALCNKELGNV